MDTLLHKHRDKIKGVLEGFDRIIFKGRLGSLCRAALMAAYLHNHGVLNKDYRDWVMNASAVIIRDAEAYSMRQCGIGTLYLPSCHIRKEAKAHEQQIKPGVANGLIGTYSCLESCNTYKAVYDKAAGFP